MTSAHSRKKQPDLVRRSLLDCAARFATEHGLSNLTIQAVADAAGVTKGGLFHHFPTKQALIEATSRDLLERLDAEIDAHLARDTVAPGRFTRAYVDIALATHSPDLSNPWAALSLSVATDPGLMRLWGDWLAGRLERHRSTDGAPMLEVVRLAADGAWLTLKTGNPVTDVAALRARLIALTGLADPGLADPRLADAGLADIGTDGPQSP